MVFYVIYKPLPIIFKEEPAINGATGKNGRQGRRVKNKFLGSLIEKGVKAIFG